MFTLTRVRRAGVVLSPDLFKLEHPGLARVGKGDTVVHNCSKQIRQSEQSERDKAYLSDPSQLDESICLFSLPVLRCEIHSDLNFTSFSLSLIIKSLLPSRIEQN